MGKSKMIIAVIAFTVAIIFAPLGKGNPSVPSPKGKIIVEGVGIGEEGKETQFITIEQSNASDLVETFGKDSELIKNKLVCRVLYRGLGLHFWYETQDANMTIFRIDILPPTEAKTNKGIVLGESTMEDVVKVYGKASWYTTEGGPEWSLDYPGIRFSTERDKSTPQYPFVEEAYLKKRVTKITVERGTYNRHVRKVDVLEGGFGFRFSLPIEWQETPIGVSIAKEYIFGYVWEPIKDGSPSGKKTTLSILVQHKPKEVNFALFRDYYVQVCLKEIRDNRCKSVDMRTGIPVEEESQGVQIKDFSVPRHFGFQATTAYLKEPDFFEGAAMIFTQRYVYRVYFRTPKDQFPKYSQTWNDIVDSIRVRIGGEWWKAAKWD